MTAWWRDAVVYQRVVCLGEAIADLVGTRPASTPGDAGELVPAPGGSLANIACVAARYGASTALVGGAGDDGWGVWLRARIAGEGVDMTRFRLVGPNSSIAFITHDERGEPHFLVHEARERPAAAAAADLEETLRGKPGVLVLGSDTLLGAAEREVTMGAAALARERGWHVLVDPNLRPGRWRVVGEMLDAVRELIAAATVAKCNIAEARELTGEAQDGACADALLRMGPEAAVVTRSERGALLKTAGGGRQETPAPAVNGVVDATGAGDCVTGVLAVALAAAGTDGLAPGLSVAMEAASRGVARRGALTGLPEVGEAERSLASALSAVR